MPEFSLALMDRILRTTSEMRISKDASIELNAVLESYGRKITKEAIRRADNEGLKTIKRTHMKKAIEEIRI